MTWFIDPNKVANLRLFSLSRKDETCATTPVTLERWLLWIVKPDSFLWTSSKPIKSKLELREHGMLKSWLEVECYSLFQRSYNSYGTFWQGWKMNLIHFSIDLTTDACLLKLGWMVEKVQISTSELWFMFKCVDSKSSCMVINKHDHKFLTILVKHY